MVLCRLLKTNLEKPVIPSDCKYVVKKDKVVVKLMKRKGEYSYETVVHPFNDSMMIFAHSL